MATQTHASVGVKVTATAGIGAKLVALSGIGLVGYGFLFLTVNFTKFIELG